MKSVVMRLTMAFFITLVFSLSLLFVLPVFGGEENKAGLEQALSELSARNPSGQAQLVHNARMLGPTAIPVLLAHLPASDSSQRQAILMTLSILRAPCEQVSLNVARYLADDMWLVRHNAAGYLGLMRCVDSASSVREQIKKESHPQVLGMLLSSLGEIGNSDDEPLLVSYDNNTSLALDIRLSAAFALAKLGYTPNRDTLAKSLASSDVGIKEKALYVLAETSDLYWLEEINKLPNGERLDSVKMIARQGIEINRISADQNKTDRLFGLLDKGSDVGAWAARRLVRGETSAVQVQRLKEIISREPLSAVAAVVMDVLREEGFINEGEYQEFYRHVYEQPGGHDHP